MIVDTVAMAIAPPAATSLAPIPSVVPTLPEYQEASDAGERTLWVVFIVMVVSAIVFTSLAWRVQLSKRVYHILTTVATINTAIAYFAMASGVGIAYHHIVVREQHKHVPDTTHDIFRQVFWARYVNWFLTTPLLLLNLAFLAGLRGGDILVILFADGIWVLTRLFAAFGKEGTPQTWGWYAISDIAYLVVVWQLGVHGSRAVAAKGKKATNFFYAIGGFTLLVWTVYPIVWGLAEGSRTISVDTEIIIYAVLDILAIPVVGALVLFTHQTTPEISVEIIGFWDQGLPREGAIRVGDDDEGA